MDNLNKLIELSHVGLRYRNPMNFFSKAKKDFWALRDLSMTVYEGEKLGIVGRNGSGKSTLMRILAGVYSVDKGNLTIHRKNLHVQLLTLGIGFEGSLTGRENAVLNGLLLGKTRRYMLSRLESIKEFSELGDFFEQPVYTYSSGMNARLGFAVAMETDPDVLLIDEVLGVGDTRFQEKSRRAIEQKFTSEQTVVLISHDANTICQMCSRAIWIENGHAMAEGEVHVVSEAYEHFLMNNAPKNQIG